MSEPKYDIRIDADQLALLRSSVFAVIASAPADVTAENDKGYADLVELQGMLEHVELDVCNDFTL